MKNFAEKKKFSKLIWQWNWYLSPDKKFCLHQKPSALIVWLVIYNVYFIFIRMVRTAHNINEPVTHY